MLEKAYGGDRVRPQQQGFERVGAGDAGGMVQEQTQGARG